MLDLGIRYPCELGACILEAIYTFCPDGGVESFLSRPPYRDPKDFETTVWSKRVNWDMAERVGVG